MAHVASVPRSIAFYAKLGFEIGGSHTPEGWDEPSWAWLTSARADLMVARASEPVVPAQQAILFYTYCPDVPAMRAHLQAQGVAVGEIEFPFWAPKGEFRITDPDGYVVMVTHT